MDIMAAAIAITKEIEKIDQKLKDSSAKSYNKIAQLNARRQALVAQLHAVLIQLQGMCLPRGDSGKAFFRLIQYYRIL